MVQCIKVLMFKARNTEQENSLGLIVAHIMVNLLKIIFKAVENIIGLMAENIMDRG